MLSRKISPIWMVMMILSGILLSGCSDILTGMLIQRRSQPRALSHPESTVSL
jgi:hypothetical protein